MLHEALGVELDLPNASDLRDFYLEFNDVPSGMATGVVGVFYSVSAGVGVGIPTASAKLANTYVY